MNPTKDVARIATIPTRHGEVVVLIAGNTVTVTTNGESVMQEATHGDLPKLVAKPGFRLGYSYAESGMRVVHLYDDNSRWKTGYSVNIDEPDFSEWGDTCIDDWVEYAKQTEKEKAAEKANAAAAGISMIVVDQPIEVIAGIESHPAIAVSS